MASDGMILDEARIGARIEAFSAESSINDIIADSSVLGVISRRPFYPKERPNYM